MKIITLLVASLLAMNVFAQSQTEEELINTFMKAEKKALVAENMNLSDDKATAFWTLYDAYSVERDALMKDRTAVLEFYVNEFNDISDEQVDEVMSSSFGSRKADTKLMQKYYKKMKKEVGVKVATRFYMVEEQIQLIVKVAIWEALPLVDSQVDKLSQLN